MMRKRIATVLCALALATVAAVAVPAAAQATPSCTGPCLSTNGGYNGW